MVLISVNGTHAAVRRQDILTSGMVGATATFLFFDEKWTGLSKVAVFRQGNVTRDVVMTGDSVTIPWEVLQLSGVPVAIGVYGASEDGAVVIPTVWAKTAPVQRGADPSGDESADPPLPVWAQMQAQINALQEQCQPAAKNGAQLFTNEYNGTLKNEIAECALSYYRNADKLYYGNDSVATCTRKNRLTPLGYYSGYVNEENYGDTFHWSALEKVGSDLFYFYPAAHPDYRTRKYNNTAPEEDKMFTCSKDEVETYMAEARAKADSIVCQIDCSSFAHLVMAGIPFENSRYAKWMNTNGDTDNTPFYEWGYSWTDEEKENYFTNRGRLGAASLAQYCYDNGYGVDLMDWEKYQAGETVRLVDWQSLRTGDLLFQTWPESDTTGFRKVGHVMIYLCPCTTGSSNEDDHWVIDVGATNETTSTTAPVSIKRVGPNYSTSAYPDVTYAGHLPIMFNKDAQPKNLVKSTSKLLPHVLEDEISLQPLTVYLDTPLKKDALYTVVVDIDLGDSYLEDNINPEIGIYYNKDFIAGRKQVKTNRYGNLYSFTLIQGQTTFEDETSFFTLRTTHNGTNPANHKKTVIRGVGVYEGVYPDSDYFYGKDGSGGKNGKGGKDGYTPVKGTDYWTEEDKAEIVDDVLAALPEIDGDGTERVRVRGWGSLDAMPGYLNTSGKVVEHTGYVVTDYLSAIPNTEITYSGLVGANRVTAYIAFYTEAKAYISSVNAYDETTTSSIGVTGSGSVNVPENAAYFRVCDNTKKAGSFSYFIEVATDEADTTNVNKEQIEALYVEKSVSGTKVAISDGAPNTSIDVVVNDGTEVEAIKTIGKNLFKIGKTTETTVSGVTYYFDAETQELVFNGTYTSGDLKVINPFALDWEIGEKYTISVRHTGGTATIGDGTGNSYAWAIFSNTLSAHVRGSTSDASFVDEYKFTGTAFDATSYIFYFQCWRKNTVFNDYRVKIQIERGGEMSEWEAYREVNTPVHEADKAVLQEGVNVVMTTPVADITVTYFITPKTYIDEVTSVKSVWNGKRWYAFGTSITDTDYPNAETGTPTGKYAKYLASFSGMTLYDNGIAGGTIGKGGIYGGSANILNKILTTDLSTADLITIEGFVNDFACEVPIGDLGDTGGTDAVADTETITICGALYRAVKHCLETAPNAIVILLTESTGKEYLMTSTGNVANYRFDLFKGEKNLCQKDYNDAIIEMGRFMGVRVIDAGSKSQINCFNPEYIVDQIHHTELGGKQYATVIWDELKNISPKVVE